MAAKIQRKNGLAKKNIKKLLFCARLIVSLPLKNGEDTFARQKKE